YNVTKHPAQARSSFERALTIGEQSYGKDDPKVAHILDKVGLAAYENRQEKDAEGFFLRSIEIREKAFGPDNPEEVQTILNLAQLYSFRRDYQKAEPLYER